MAHIAPTTQDDFSRIQEWISKDPWHRDDPYWVPEGLLTGNGALSFCVSDTEGPLCYVRLDAEDEMLRLATQFGPEEEVSRKRLVAGLLSAGIPAIIEFGKSKGYRGIVFETVSPSLIAFMEKQGFLKTAKENDYALVFRG
jgi:hypothetical protein